MPCRKPKIIGFDTETYLQHGEYKFLSAQFYSPPLKIKHFITDPKDLHKIFNRKTRGAILLAFNAEYDFSVLYKILKEKFEFRVLYNGGRFIAGRILSPSGYVWKVYDLLNIFVNWNLRKLGEFLNFPKLDKPSFLGLRKPENAKEWLEFKKYAMTDARICYKAGKWLLQNFGTIRLTAPSLSFHVFNRDFKRYPIYPAWPDSLMEKIRLAYKGGRSEAWIRGSPDKKVYVYDVVSLYPYVMANYKYPLAISDIKQKSDVDLSKEGVAECTVIQDADIPFLSLRMFTSDGSYKLVFPNGKFTSYFTYPELRYFEWSGLGKILKVHKAYEVVGSNYVFSDFVKYYFEKKQNDLDNSAFWKLFLNSLYGKFGQCIKNSWYKLTPIKKLEKVEKETRPKFKPRRNLLIASYITARGRIYMHQQYKKVGPQNMVYTDTDSIHTFKRLNAEGNGLGSLSFKGETDGDRRATYIRSKFYLFNDVLKCKGLHYVLKAEEMRKLIEIGDIKVLSKFVLRLRSAFARHKPLLSETEMLKQFTLNSDEKRVYCKALFGKQLLEDYTDSEAVWLYGLV
jgi:hypothetical protein